MFKYSIWPVNKIRLGRYFKFNFSFPRSSTLEQKIKSMFPSGTPVLCSSGRAAINMVLLYQNQTRPDLIGVNYYTSHCVLDSISRIATPVIWDPNNFDIKKRIIYHQYGYIKNENSVIDGIDDCVDTLCDLNTKLFPTNKTFEIWSLPKILGTSSGAILWCKTEYIAKKMRNIRDKKGGGFFYWILRVFGLFSKNNYWLWQGIAAEKAKLSRLELFEINNAIKYWRQIIKDRKIKLELLWKFAPEWINKPKERLPCVVPLEFKNYKNNKYLESLEINIRHFEKVVNSKKRDLIKVYLIPIHQDISINAIKEIINNI